MSPRLLAVAFLLAAAFVPATVPSALAQNAATTTLTLEQLPTADQSSAENVAAFAFKVHLQISQFVCLPGPGQVTVNLSATPGNATAGAPSTQFDSATKTFDVPTTGAVATSYSQTQDAVLLVRNPSGQAAKVPVSVSASIAGVSGCSLPWSAAGAATPQSFNVDFAASPNSQATGSQDAPVPGFEAPLLLAAVVAGVALLRRRQT